MKSLPQMMCDGLMVGIAALQLHGTVAPTQAPTPPVPHARAAPGVVVRKMTKHPRGTIYAKQGFLEHLPAAYGTGKSPLLIAYHGKGENGVGDEKSLEMLHRNGVPGLIGRNQWPEATRPFVVLAPQHEGIACPTVKEVADFIDFAKAHYQIDDERVYLTGLSCGARGVADYLRTYGPKGIAATVLVAGDLAPAVLKQKCELPKRLPLWIFHGIDDQIVRIGGDDAAVEFMRTDCTDQRDLNYTRYPDVGHDSWTKAYGDKDADVFSWMLKFKSSPSVTANAQPRRGY